VDKGLIEAGGPVGRGLKVGQRVDKRLMLLATLRVWRHTKKKRGGLQVLHGCIIGKPEKACLSELALGKHRETSQKSMCYVAFGMDGRRMMNNAKYLALLL